MIRAKNMILIGGAARASGKTAFAVRLIERMSRSARVIGIKFTPAHDEEPSPLDSNGAGLEESFHRPFRIGEEDTASDRTDTGRMKSAGAQKVFRVQARRGHAAAAAEELFRRLPPASCLVAEGNSLRAAVEPGLFVLLRRADSPEVKDSYAAALPMADRTVVFDGRDWDFPPGDCLFLDGEWMLKPRAGAIVLAGGDSRRMGRDKSLLTIEGRPMIERIVRGLERLFDEILIGANPSQDFRFLGREVVPDLEPGQGPLMGLASCLRRARFDLNFVTACDLPDIPLGFAARLAAAAEGRDMVIPVEADGLFEPLFAVYRKSVADPAMEILAEGKRSLLELLTRVRVKAVPLPDGVALASINTWDDYRKRAGRPGGGD